MSVSLSNPTNILNQLEKGKKAFFWTGIGFSVTGLLALVYPFIATLSLTYFISVLFFVTGLFTFFNSFSLSGTGPFFGSILLGLLKIACSSIILSNPMIGMLYLTSLIAFVFMFEGAYEMTFAFELKPQKGWGWKFFSSLISIISGIAIISTIGMSSLWLTGLIFGVNFLSTGVALFFLSRNV